MTQLHGAYQGVSGMMWLLQEEFSVPSRAAS